MANKGAKAEGGNKAGIDMLRDAESAVLAAMGNLRKRGILLSSETVPPDAAKRLSETRPSQLTVDQARLLVDAAVTRLQSDGQIYAASQPSIFWRRLRG